MLVGGTYKEGGSEKYEDAIQQYEEDSWKTVGLLNVSRSSHAVSAVHYEDFCPTPPTADDDMGFFVILTVSLCGLLLVVITLVCIGLRCGSCRSTTVASTMEERDSENGHEMILRRRPGVTFDSGKVIEIFIVNMNVI